MNLSILVAVAFSAVSFVWFLRLERAGRRIGSVIFVFVMLIADLVLFENQDGSPEGLFHPQIGAQSFRLPDIVVPLALLARLLVGRRPRRISVSALWWAAFLVWLTTAAVLGVAENSATHATFEGKAVIYLGAMALAAGVPAREYTETAGFVRLLQAAALLAATLTVLDKAALSINVNVPGIVVARIGKIGGDPATTFAVLGIIALMLGLCREANRLPLLLAAAALLVPALVAGQRAAVVGLAGSLLAVLLFAPFAPSRWQTTATELAVAGALVVAILVFPIWLGAVSGGRSLPRIANPSAQLASSYYATFQRAGKRGSAEARVNQWRAASTLIKERPMLGWGLGKTYVHYDPGISEFVVSDLTHNIAIDLLLRTGLAGMFLFLVSLALSLRDGIRAWLHDTDRSTAALALAGTAAVVGLVGKGMVESTFEKYRLATLLGLMLGILLSVAGHSEEDSWG